MNTPRNFTSFITDPWNFPMDAPSSIILLGVQLITPIGLLNRTPRGIRGIIPQGVWFRIKLGYSRKNCSRGYTAKWADFGLLGDLRHICINFINLLIKKNYLKDFYSDCSSTLKISSWLCQGQKNLKMDSISEVSVYSILKYVFWLRQEILLNFQNMWLVVEISSSMVESNAILLLVLQIRVYHSMDLYLRDQ